MNRSITRLLSPLLCGLGLGMASPAQAGFTPVAVTGFTADIVANGTGTVIATTTADMDGGNVGTRYAFMAPNYVSPTGAVPTVALPATGLINSVATSGLSFQLASYSANNSLRIPGTGIGAGTLALTTAQAAGEVYLLASSGNGASTMTVTVTFSDLTTQVFAAQTVNDWFGGTGFAIQGIGRVNYDNNLIENNTTDPRLYQLRLPLLAANYAKTIQSIGIAKTSTTGTLNVMAVSLNSVCAGTPAGGTAVASVASVCASTSVTLSLTGSSGDVGIGYQWQASTNGGTTWTPITGATGSAYTTTGQSVTTQYRAVLTCSVSSLTATSAPVTVTTVAPTYATLPVTQSFENAWVDVCATRDAPTATWRTSPTTGNSSWRRDDDGASAVWTSPTIGIYAPTASQGSRSARFHSYSAGANAVGSLDLYVNLSAAGAKRLSFDYVNTAGNDSLYVLLSTDGGATFSRLARYGLSGTVAQGFVTQVVNIASTSATAVIRFRANVTATFTSDIGLDNLVLEVATGCLTPATLTATGVTANTATLSWLTGGTGTYSVLYGPTGFNPALPASTTNVYTTVPGITAPPYSLTGLTPSTAYQFYVVQNCAAGATSGLAGPVAFTTACVTPVYATLPVTESFENTWISRCDTREVPTNSWRNTPLNGDPSWRRNDDGAAGGWTSPASWSYAPAASQGTFSARFHSGEVLAPDPLFGTLDLFVNLSAAGAKRLSFDFINTSGVDSLVVQLSTDGGATFGRLAGYNLSGTVATGFVTQVLPITATSATAVLRFRARGDYGVTDIGLDNIVLELASGCLTPAVLTATTTTTTAALAWLTGGPGTYTVLYGPTGFNPALPASATNVYTTVAGLTTPPYSVSGLAPGTTYQFYVTQNCAAGTNSGTAGPVAFTTQIINDEPCGATTLIINNTCVPTATTTVGATATAGIAAGTCANFPTATPPDVWFKFTTAATGPTSTQVRLSVTGASANTLRLYSGACTGPLAFLACASSTGSTAAAPDLDATSLTPNTTYYVRVGLYGTSVATAGPFTICATPVPNCPTPSGLATGTLTNTTAVLTWSAPAATGSTFTVFYGPTGLTPPAGTALTSLTAQTATLTGLTPNTGYCFYVRQVCGGFNGSSVASPVVCFTTPLTAPANDEPCGAITLGTAPISSTNVGATTTVQPTIITPACSPAAFPKDVWFAFTPAGPTASLVLTGSAAGMVRVFTTPNCASGPFTAIFCAGLASNTSVGTVNLTGLTAGQRYYAAVSGFGSADATGPFTISATNLLASRAQADAEALLVYPNPSSSGQLTLRLSGLSGPGHAALLNALGQVVLTKALAPATPEQTLATRALAAGLYTLRVTVAGQTYTRKVVLE